MDRTRRQRLCIRRWLDCNGKGVIEACTGFGNYINFYYNDNCRSFQKWEELLTRENEESLY